MMVGTLMAMVVCACVAAYFFIRMDERMHVLERAIETATELAKQGSNSAVLAQLDDMRGAIDTLTASNRRELSSLWKRVGRAEAKRDDSHDDPRFDALLRLQQADPSRQ
jgi:hypothetical protein